MYVIFRPLTKIFSVTSHLFGSLQYETMRVERWCRIVTEGPPDYFSEAPTEVIPPKNLCDTETKRELESEVQEAISCLANKMNIAEIGN